MWCVCGRGSNFILCMWMFSCINTICLRDYSFPMAQNSLTLGRWAYFWCLSSLPAVYMSSFILVPLCFWWPLLYFCNKFWNQGVWVLQFCSFSSRMLRLFEGPCNYRCIWELAFLFLKKKMKFCYRLHHYGWFWLLTILCSRQLIWGIIPFI